MFYKMVADLAKHCTLHMAINHCSDGDRPQSLAS